jgi:uncharacterized protein with FMN-binding domain
MALIDPSCLIDCQYPSQFRPSCNHQHEFVVAVTLQKTHQTMRDGNPVMQEHQFNERLPITLRGRRVSAVEAL